MPPSLPLRCAYTAHARGGAGEILVVACGWAVRWCCCNRGDVRASCPLLVYCLYTATAPYKYGHAFTHSLPLYAAYGHRPRLQTWWLIRLLLPHPTHRPAPCRVAPRCRTRYRRTPHCLMPPTSWARWIVRRGRYYGVLLERGVRFVLRYGTCLPSAPERADGPFVTFTLPRLVTPAVLTDGLLLSGSPTGSSVNNIHSCYIIQPFAVL